jgi:hypothetical protein
MAVQGALRDAAVADCQAHSSHRPSPATLFVILSSPSVHAQECGDFFVMIPDSKENAVLQGKIMVTTISAEILGQERLAGRHLGEEEIRHALERVSKRIEHVGNGFRGTVAAEAGGKNLIIMDFPTLSEAGLAAIEIQRRIADLTPFSGIRLAVRLGIHEAQTLEAARDIAAQLMAFALPEQILCGREILNDQVHSLGVGMRDLHQIKLKDGKEFPVVEIVGREETPVSLVATSVLSLAQPNHAPARPKNAEATPGIDENTPLTVPPSPIHARLCVRYQGKALLLDGKTPFITIGRERSNDLVVNDYRVSRQHARIERKEGQYYLVDVSTNGSFVLVQGAKEIFLRRESLRLLDKGVISFSALSHSDPQTQRIEFEFL